MEADWRVGDKIIEMEYVSDDEIERESDDVRVTETERSDELTSEENEKLGEIEKVCDSDNEDDTVCVLLGVTDLSEGDTSVVGDMLLDRDSENVVDTVELLVWLIESVNDGVADDVGVPTECDTDTGAEMEGVLDDVCELDVLMESDKVMDNVMDDV